MLTDLNNSSRPAFFRHVAYSHRLLAPIMLLLLGFTEEIETPTKTHFTCFFSCMWMFLLNMCAPFRISIEVRKFVRDYKGRAFGGEEIQCDGKKGEDITELKELCELGWEERVKDVVMNTINLLKMSYGNLLL